MSFKKSIGSRKKLAIGIASGVAMLVSSAVFSAESARFDIAAGEAGKRLMELAEDASAQIVIPRGIDKSIQLSAISGDFTLAAALDEMLKGTGLSYEFTSENSVVIIDAVQSGKEDDVSKAVEEVVVTGTRLRGVNPGAQTVSIDREEMDRRGYVSVEDVLRGLPQNHSNANTTLISLGGQGLNGGSSGNPGQSFANLRGLGSRNTLVLVNGRRQAGTLASSSGNEVDLNSIPFSSIERIDVMLDGGSAIYGSDALGGVINVITRKDFSGMEVGARYQDNESGGNLAQLGVQFGYGWDSGDLTVSVARTEIDPDSPARAGYTTNDLRSIGGQDQRFTAIGESPLVLTPPTTIFFPGFGEFTIPGSRLGALPADYDGSPLTDADVFGGNVSEANFRPLDRVRLTYGPETESTDFSLFVRQELTDNVSMFFEGRYTDRESFQVNSGITIFNAPVDSGTAFNQSSMDLAVTHTLDKDIAAGILPSGGTNSESQTKAFALGADIELAGDWLLHVEGSYSESEDSTSEFGFIPAMQMFYGKSQEVLDIEAAFAAALNGTDPESTVNLFGDRTINPHLLLPFYGTANSFGANNSETSGLSAHVEGALFELPAGEVRVSVGGEYREETRKGSSAATRTISDGKRELLAGFVEVGVPVISDENALPGVQSLDLTLQARYDDYAYPDVVAFDTSDPMNPVHLGSEEFKFGSGVIPRIGLNWRVVDDLAITASWGESFRAPDLTQLQTDASDFNTTFPYVDPFAPAGTPPAPTGYLYQPNLNIQPETSETLTYGFEWTPSMLDGFTVSATYNRITTENQIGSTGQLGAEDWQAMGEDAASEFFLRAPDGTLIAILVTPINIGKFVSEAVDFNIDYQFDSQFGAFQLGVNGTHSIKSEQTFNTASGGAFTSGHQPNRVGTESGPDDWVGNFYTYWDKDNYGASLIVNYSSSYINSISDRPAFFDPETDLQKVEGYWTVDLTGSYEWEETGLKFQIGARNLTNNDRPFYNARFGGPFDLARTTTTGRMLFLDVKKSFDFGT